MRTTIMASALTIAAATAAHAQEPGSIYVEGGYTNLDVTVSSDIDSVDDLGDNVHALTARAGYQFNEFFSVEADASFGIDEGDFDFQGDREDFFSDGDDDQDLGDVVAASGDGDLGVDYLIGVYGKATYPLSERVDIFARAGYAFVEADLQGRLDPLPGEAETDPIELASGDDDGFAIGAGISASITESLTVRGDYTRYEFDDVDTNAFGVTLGYAF
ncbi:MAG: porin family protein [Parvularcula sp.]|jgi:opacity protein-like surface antigen|nr:porin family protein [Parvularcula sp.]